MIVGPPTNDGVELRYQMAGCGLLVRLHDVPDVPKEGVHLLRGGFNEEFPRVLPDVGTGSVEWERLPILKQSLIQTPVQFSRDPYVVEIPGRMGICMPYVVYPINSSRVFVRELFYIQIA